MTATSIPLVADRSTARSIARSGLVVALLDGTWAVVLFTLVLQRATPAQIWLGVARSVLGPDAQYAGAPGVALGLTIHLCVATTWSALYLAAIRLWPWMRRVAAGRAAPLLGLGWGAFVWLMMDLVVMPLTHARPSPIGSPNFYYQLVGHPFVVGLPIALLMRREARR